MSTKAKASYPGAAFGFFYFWGSKREGMISKSEAGEPILRPLKKLSPKARPEGAKVPKWQFLTRSFTASSQCAGGLADPCETVRPKDSWLGIPLRPSIPKNIFLKSPPMASHIIKKIKTV